MRLTVWSLMLFSLVAMAGCGSGSSPVSSSPPSAPNKTSAGAPKSSPAPSTSATAPSKAPTSQAAPTKATSGNELGRVFILEFHNFGATPERWQASVSEFKDALAWLYSHNFRPVNMAAYASGTMDLPAGTHPVVLTFDDGDPSQFVMLPNGQPDPNSAVGMLYAFHQAHPDWALRGTFFVNANPFGKHSKEKVQWLVSHGFEIGNHTWGHVNMSNISAADTAKQLGMVQAQITGWVPGYVFHSFALPFGILSHNAAALNEIKNGSWNGQSWSLSSVVLVGASPAYSPYSTSFDPYAVPRIQVAAVSTLKHKASARYVFAGWETWAESHPSRLYTSDGNPNTITFPSSESKYLSPAYRSKANPITAGP